jgi:hypothetical protein
MGFPFRALVPALAALALYVAVPPPAQAQTVEQEFSRLNADRAHRLGVQQYRVQNYDLALRHFERAVALAPDVEAYRHSLALTKQRIAIVRAKRRALQENLDRARKSLVESEASPSESPLEDDGSDAAGTPESVTRALNNDPFLSRPNLPIGTNPFNDEPILPGIEVRDANRDLGLGGGRAHLGEPSDLPVSGSDSFDLPIGRLPPELRPQLRPGVGTQQSEAPDPTSGEGSMFPFLDPPSDPVPIGPSGRTGESAPSVDRPNLDTPETLP